MELIQGNPVERSAPTERPIAGLRQHVDAFVEATTLSERTDAFVALVRWTRHGWGAPEDGARTRGRTHDDLARFDAFLSLLEDEAEQRRFHLAMGTLFSESDGTLAFAHAGLPSERGFLTELCERVMNHLLPRPRDDGDLGNLLRRLFRSDGDVERMSLMPAARFVRLAASLFPTELPEAMVGLRHSLANGFRLLATWTLAQGLSPKLRKRSRPGEITESPFYGIARASEAVVERWLSGNTLTDEAEAWRRECERCRDAMVEIHRRIEREGVSTQVVYGLEVIERCLTRMSAMVDVMVLPTGANLFGAVHRLLVTLAKSVRDDHSVRHLLWWNTHLLQRRIVERSGRTGEHYITATRAEYRQMWLAAAGGGLLTVGTAAIKTVISGWHTSDFAHGFLYGLNYAVSFLLLQRLGLVLATKQPAMTAAALATIMRERRGEERLREIATYAARISRSQLAAVLGNVLVVSAGAAMFVYLWELIFAHPFLAESEAQAVYHQLSPFSSGTVFYAALTGVILWLASVAGGWFDNFCVYHRLPLAIAQHPVGRYFGYDRMQRWSESLSQNASGWATNVSLGFMLGMTPALGHFLGLPLDVRHVTLNSGILSLASASLGRRWFGGGMFLLGIAGVGVMFALNLSVSFLLSLVTAARAYELPAAENRALFRALYRRFIDAPRDFLLPPRTDPEPNDSEEHHSHP
jgi:site-specific recombinase